jgi:hypothetical protein
MTEAEMIQEWLASRQPTRYPTAFARGVRSTGELSAEDRAVLAEKHEKERGRWKCDRTSLVL